MKNSVIDYLSDYLKQNKPSDYVKIRGYYIPSDYNDFCHTFNISGLIDYFWLIRINDNYSECVKDKKEMYYTLKNEERKDRLVFPSSDYPRYPFDFYPKKEGILPWAYADNGTNFFWKTYKKKPWSIIVYDEMFVYFEYEMSTTEFLY